MSQSSNSTPDFTDLANRLRSLSIKEPKRETDINAIMTMSFDELKGTPVSFGQAHLGKTFEEMLQHPQYLTWFAGTYKDSRKAAHVKMLRFIQLHVEQMENEPKDPKSTKSSKSHGRVEPRPKAKIPEKETDFESDEEQWDRVVAEPAVTASDMMAVQNRMAQIEVVMQQVLQHLSPAANPSPP